MYFGNTDLSSGKVELTKFLDIVLPPERVVERKRAFHFIVATHTINQFFGSEQSATQFMSNVAALLTEDGLFIALFESPTERIAQYESSREFKRARKLKPTQVYAAFGAVLPGSDEYLLFVKSLVDIADKVGLEPRVHYPESLATLFKHEDLYRNVKNFNDSIVCVVFHRRKEQYRHHHHQ